MKSCSKNRVAFKLRELERVSQMRIECTITCIGHQSIVFLHNTRHNILHNIWNCCNAYLLSFHWHGRAPAIEYGQSRLSLGNWYARQVVWESRSMSEIPSLLAMLARAVAKLPWSNLVIEPRGTSRMVFTYQCRPHVVSWSKFPIRFSLQFACPMTLYMCGLSPCSQFSFDKGRVSSSSRLFLW